MEDVKVNYGLRGTKYFAEFNVIGKNVDAFSLLASCQNTIEKGKKMYGSKVIGTDSYFQDGNVSYLVDYSVDSTSCEGTKSKGSVYVRGVKGDNGFDSFKVICEK